MTVGLLHCNSSTKNKPMAITFRSAELSDIAHILQMNKELNEFTDSEPDTPRIESGLQKFIGHPEYGEVWLICDNDTAVGYMVLTWGFSLEFGGRDAFLDEFYIKETHRGQGIGKQALTFAEGQCHLQEIQAIHLEVETDNVGAQEFYKRLGFEQRDRYYLMSKYL